MKKSLAITLAGGILAGAVFVSQPSEAVPFTPDAIVAKRPVPQQQTQDPQKGWDIPDLADNGAIKPVIGDDGKPVIQVALLLDTSGSMSSLIDQAKTELWSIVNKLGEAKYKGQSPKIEVALYEYGKSTLARDEGYIRQLAPFTHDLDGISEILFALQTNGGDEYCAWVIRSALDSLKWKKRKGSLRMIFVAGNEPFTQGPVEFKPVLGEASEKGVLIHPIYCSNGNRSDQVSWQRAAEIANTDLKIIDHTRVVRVPKTPYDDKISKLGTELNGTYVGYGRDGRAKMARQRKQDSNMYSVSAGAAAERQATKASANYRNTEWDVVDRAEESGLGSIAEDELPGEMKKMSKPEREAYVKGKAKERKRIQGEIKVLNKKRQQYIAKQQTKDSAATLGQAVVKTVRVKAKKAGFTL